MNEQEILTQLRKAAEEIEIPETLKPEQIEKQLQEQKAKQQQENQHLEPKKSKKIIPWRRLGSMVSYEFNSPFVSGQKSKRFHKDSCIIIYNIL